MSDSERVAVNLYEAGEFDKGVVQTWHNWPHPLPEPGDRVLLADGEWRVVGRLFNPSAEAVLLFAEEPHGRSLRADSDREAAE